MKITCPHCQTEHTVTHGPNPEDYCICPTCFRVSIYTEGPEPGWFEDGQLQLEPIRDVSKLAPELSRTLQAAIAAARAKAAAPPELEPEPEPPGAS